MREYTASLYGRVRKVIATRREVLDGLQVNVYSLECGHTVKVNASMDGSRKKPVGRRCKECPHQGWRPMKKQKGYVVLSAEERSKGFVRPVRYSYIHKPCGSKTSMGIALAETYARAPYFYSGTFCCKCAQHFPLDQFVWTDGEQLGT